MSEVTKMSDAWKKFIKLGDTVEGKPEEVGWGSLYTQSIRFQVLKRIVNLVDKNILDVGCGYGALEIYLDWHKIRYKNIVGVDLIDELINKARENKRGTYLYGDISDQNFSYKFDVTFASGIFNIKVDNWQKQTTNTLDKMWDLTEEAMVFNIGTHLPHNYITDPNFWINYCRVKYSQFLTYTSNYLQEDFTIAVFRRLEKQQ